MAESSSQKKLKVGDRVKRASGQGPQGVVKELRYEVTSAGHTEQKDKSLMVNVQWDNGTLSYFSPNVLELVK